MWMQVRIQRGREVDGFSAASPLSAEFRARGLHKSFCGLGLSLSRAPSSEKAMELTDKGSFMLNHSLVYTPTQLPP